MWAALGIEGEGWAGTWLEGRGEGITPVSLCGDSGRLHWEVLSWGGVRGT